MKHTIVSFFKQILLFIFKPLVFLIKPILFLIAYSPLFTLILLQSIPQYNIVSDLFGSNGLDVFSSVCICFLPMILAPLVGIGIYKNAQKITVVECLKFNSVKDKTGDILSYVVPYIISLMSFNVLSLNGLLSLLILIVILYPIYANSSLIYINPVLLLCGYRLYKVTVRHPISLEKSTEVPLLLISQSKNIIADKPIHCCNLSDKIYLEVNCAKR